VREGELQGTGLADLHVHTTASDGTLTPEQTIREAARLGLAGIGIVDHDTVAGIESALAEGHLAGIEVVPGVEINTDWGKDEIHILGYFIDHRAEGFERHLELLRTGRYERGKKIVERLKSLGVDISYDRVLDISGEGSVGRPHIARAIVEAGYAQSLNSAFGRYLIRGTPAYVPRYKLTPIQAIEIVYEAQGVPVLAHPGNSKHDEVIPSLVEAGLKGIEAYHTDHHPNQAARYVEVARKYHLLVTGGSDSHGPEMVKPVEIGSVTVSMSVVHALRELASEIRRAETHGNLPAAQ
jgi:hypothetical protein